MPGRVIRPRGELDLSTAPALRDELLSAVRAVSVEDCRVIEVDLRDVSFMDVTAVSVLVLARERLVAAGGQLRLTHPARSVARLLALVGLQDLISD